MHKKTIFISTFVLFELKIDKAAETDRDCVVTSDGQFLSLCGVILCVVVSFITLALPLIFSIANVVACVMTCVMSHDTWVDSYVC